MKRKIAAFLAFNVYSLVFVQSFWAATPYIFHSSELGKLNERGLPFRFEDWGFDDHYFWRLCAAVVSTAFAGFICGTISREKGGQIAAWANAPSIIGWMFYGWMFFFYFDSLGIEIPPKVESLKSAYGVISLIAIPLTTWLAYRAGNFGVRWQLENNGDRGTLGIWDWHWAWFPIVLSFYGYRIVHVATVFVVLQLKTWFDTGIIAGFVSLLGLLIVAAWVAPLVISFQVLRGQRDTDKPAMRRAVMVAGYLVGGYVVAHFIQLAVGWIFGKFGI